MKTEKCESCDGTGKLIPLTHIPYKALVFFGFLLVVISAAVNLSLASIIGVVIGVSIFMFGLTNLKDILWDKHEAEIKKLQRH